MERLWAPWRLKYILDNEGKEKEDSQCIFCEIPKQSPSKDNLLLFKNQFTSVIINKFPYNNGHLLVVPLNHCGLLEDLNTEESIDLFNVLQVSAKIIKQAYNPDGLNVGMNIGSSAGAGIAEHIHFHVVPRWDGDNNFMPVINETKVLPELLEQTFDKLLPLFQKI